MKTLEDYLKQNPKTHLIFDLDETIVKLLLPWDEWFEDVLGKIKEKYPDFSETEYVQIHNKLVEQRGEEGRELIRLLNEKFETEKIMGIEENKELIEFIKSNPNYEYYLWSSNSGATVRKFLKEVGIDHVFKKIVTRSESDFLKPNTSGFKLLAEPGVSIDQYLFIGDSSRDSLAAKELGIDFFLIDYFKGSF
ncbi:MAG TPA: HAD-IA family hydrolase [Patescibacteria group bacterium]|nr:HAD-IA family hydrolase [Patescibacteria group bacterium]